MFLLTAMGPPGGGRTVISRRLQSRFNLINMTFPQVSLNHIHVLNCIIITIIFLVVIVHVHVNLHFVNVQVKF